MRVSKYSSKQGYKLYSSISQLAQQNCSQSTIWNNMNTLRKTNSSHLKMDGWNTTYFHFGARPIFRCELLVYQRVYHQLNLDISHEGRMKLVNNSSLKETKRLHVEKRGGGSMSVKPVIFLNHSCFPILICGWIICDYNHEPHRRNVCINYNYTKNKYIMVDYQYKARRKSLKENKQQNIQIQTIYYIHPFSIYYMFRNSVFFSSNWTIQICAFLRIQFQLSQEVEVSNFLVRGDVKRCETQNIQSFSCVLYHGKQVIQ